MKTKKCEECEAEMVFLENPKTERKVPVDVDSLSEEDVELLERGEEVPYRAKEHVSHFTTCTNPRRFSRK